MAAEGAGGRELAELVAHHGLGDEHRDVLATVVHRDGVTQHRRDDHRAARPGLDHVLVAGLVRRHDLAEQVVVDEGALLQTAWHLFVSYYLRFLPTLRRRTINLSLGRSRLRVRPSFWPHGETG